MNEPLSDFIYGDSRSGGLARVCPASQDRVSNAARGSNWAGLRRNSLVSNDGNLAVGFRADF